MPNSPYPPPSIAPVQWRMLLVWEAWAKQEGNDGAATLFRDAHDALVAAESDRERGRQIMRRIVEQRNDAEDEIERLRTRIRELEQERVA